MKNVVDTNTDELLDSRGLVIVLGDLVALATPGRIKTGRVIGFKPSIDKGVWTTIPATVVVQCHDGCQPSFVRYAHRNLLCIERFNEGEPLT